MSKLIHLTCTNCGTSGFFLLSGNPIKCNTCGNLLWGADVDSAQEKQNDRDAAFEEYLNEMDAKRPPQEIDAMFGKMLDMEVAMHLESFIDKVVPIDSAKINDIVRFGKYVWDVIDKKGDAVLLISHEIIPMEDEDEDDSYYYDDAQKEYNRIRNTLRSTFLNDNFNDQEKEKIIETEVNYGKEKSWEKIFILSEAEVKKLFVNKNDRAALAFLPLFGEAKKPWGLRNEKDGSTYIFVDEDGEIVKEHDYGDFYYRPSLWVRQQNEE